MKKNKKIIGGATFLFVILASIVIWMIIQHEDPMSIAENNKSCQANLAGLQAEKSTSNRNICVRKIKSFYSPKIKKCVFFETCNNFRGKNKLFSGKLVDFTNRETILKVDTRDLLEYKDFEDSVKKYKN